MSNKVKTEIMFLFFRVVFTVVGLIECVTEFTEVGPCHKIRTASCPDPEYVQFKLFSRTTEGSGEVLDLTTNNESHSKFNKEYPTKVIIHGFKAFPDAPYIIPMRTEYLKKGQYNLITVDWSYLARGPEECRPVAVHNIRHVGECTGQLVQRLRQMGATDIHAIGHSMGAQTLNYVAKFVSPKLPRFTGLDPTGPGFNGSTDEQLDKADAVFVDIVHTNAKHRGKLEAVGHVDFYMNNGIEQPGCDGDAACSHRRSIDYFVESITTTRGFFGRRCSSVSQVTSGNCDTSAPRDIQMGDAASTSSRGIVGVPTGGMSPYALGKGASTA